MKEWRWNIIVETHWPRGRFIYRCWSGDNCNQRAL